MKFLRISILKNICERLLLKISTSAVNLRKGEVSPDFIILLKYFSILNFVNGLVMQHAWASFFFVFFSQTYFYHKTHQVRCYYFFIVEIIVEGVSLMQMSN